MVKEQAVKSEYPATHPPTAHKTYKGKVRLRGESVSRCRCYGEGTSYTFSLQLHAEQNNTKTIYSAVYLS